MLQPVVGLVAAVNAVCPVLTDSYPPSVMVPCRWPSALRLGNTGSLQRAAIDLIYQATIGLIEVT